MSDEDLFKYKVTYKPDGKKIVEVLNRGTQDCNSIIKVTQQMGTFISDEHLPDGSCPPTIHEVSGGG